LITLTDSSIGPFQIFHAPRVHGKVCREEIMTCEWYRNALAEGEQRGMDKGREEGREEGRQALLNMARKILPVEAVNVLEKITDINALETAISAEYEALAH